MVPVLSTIAARVADCRKAKLDLSQVTRHFHKSYRRMKGVGPTHWFHAIGGRCRARAGSVALSCRWPHDRQIGVPTLLMSVSFAISLSRTAVEPAMTGPEQASQG